MLASQVHSGVVIDCIIKSVYFRGRCYRSLWAEYLSAWLDMCIASPSLPLFLFHDKPPIPKPFVSEREGLKANTKRQPLTNLRSRKRLHRTASYALGCSLSRRNVLPGSNVYYCLLLSFPVRRISPTRMPTVREDRASRSIHRSLSARFDTSREFRTSVRELF